MLLSGVDLTTGATLTLTSGAITTDANKVIANSTVSRTSGFVAGKLQKPVASGSSTVTFEVGTGSTYAPISVPITGANSGGNLSGG